VFFYYLYSQSLEDKDHEILKARFKEYNAIHHLGGIKALDTYMKSPDISFKENADFFVRIESRDHNTLFFQSEGKTSIFSLKEIEHGVYGSESDKEQWIYIKTKRSEDDLEVLSIRLQNGDYLQIGKTVDDRDDLVERFEETFLEVILVALILGGLGGTLLSNRVLHPLRDLISTLQSLSKGNEEARVPLPGTKDELEDIAVLFNKMLDRIKTSNQSMRQTLDTVAHELRTPLTSIRGLAEVTLHKKSFSEQDARQVLEDCIEGIDEILTEFKMMTDITEVESGLQNLKKETVELESICQDIIDLYEIIADEKEISIKLQEPAAKDKQLSIYADRKKVRQALANLVDNAIKYSPENSEINVSFYRHNQQAVIRVSDQGIGINSEELPHIWKRLYRGENGRKEKGIGLGLSLVKSIVEAHNGTIDVETEEGKGSTFIIKLPC
jgi:signal transduction histidine kinase